jgi:hypothetical protein
MKTLRFPRLLVAPALCLLVLSASLPGQEGILGIPMSRAGSGTSWLPDASPMHAAHAMRVPWELMSHGVAFLQYDRQGGTRGGEQLGSVNWGMLMATRDLGGGRLQLRGMMSLEPFTVGARGYPLLLQSGEAYRGEPLHDRQHPHDLFMEVAAQYERAIARNLGFSLYVAPVGEPAVGPVAFPHRPSAANDPFAPIAHHWQDATHISFGAVTAGVFTRTVKLEGSAFNGREPDENRTNVDYKGRSLDSWAGRVTWNPSARWSLSGSFAYLRSPEGLRPGESVHRVTASVLHARPVGADGSFTASAVYGANRRAAEHASEPSWLAEGNLDFRGRHHAFARAEFVRKEAADLALPPSVGADRVNVGEATLGYAYDLNRGGPFRVGIGVSGSLNVVPQSLESVYGNRTPGGVAVFLRLRPPAMPETHHHMMDGMPMDGARAGAAP